jgi:hypothetical protein
MDLNSSDPIIDKLIANIAMPEFCGAELRDRIQAMNPGPADETASFIRRPFGSRDRYKAVQDSTHR